MPSPLLMPVTLMTAAVFGLICVALGVNVIRGRFKHRMAHGDQGNQDMVVRMRTQANFTEYVPIGLILLALLEISGANPIVLAVGAAAFVVLRILHAIGMHQTGTFMFRRTGAMGTFALLIAASVWAFVISIMGLTA